MNDLIKIRGARQHNLKNISLDIPKNKLVVMTGVSGSGKSSLAFDTLYAEGQRRYVESLSAYARQFLGVMDKPDVDLIEGLSPSISIDQKTASHNPRSTVGTITEIYDFLRLLFARIGHPHCPNCKVEVSKLSSQEITDLIIKEVRSYLQKMSTKPFAFQILSPIIRQKKGEFSDLIANLQSKGYSKAVIDSKLINLDTELNLIKTNKHDISVIIDNFSLTQKQINDKIFFSSFQSRVQNSVEQSLNLSSGLVLFTVKEKNKLFSEKFSCPNCNLSLPEIEPRMFSFNSPLGACENCKGIGNVYKIEPDLILNKKLTILEGGILPFNRLFFHETRYIRVLKQMAEEENIDINLPIEKLTDEKLKKLLYGTQKIYEVKGKNRFGKETMIYEKFIGVIPELERRYFTNVDGFATFEIQKYMREETCDKCKGKKLKPEILAITVDAYNISQMADLPVHELLEYFKEKIISKLSDYEQQVAKPIMKELITRLTFLDNVGLNYLTISRTAKTLAGGELQRIRLASQIGTGLTGVLYVLDEPSIGLHPKDVSALINTLRNLVNLGNTLVVVEHDQETMEAADHLIELGPQAGKKGGKIMFEGTIEQIKKSDSLTGKYLSGAKKINFEKRKLNLNHGSINLQGATQFNLKKINIKIPLGNLVAVTGVSGSGKSTLITETLYPALKYYLDGYYQDKMGDFERIEGYQYLDRVYFVDQSPIGRTPRSNPATYIGIFDEIRTIFAETVEAKMRGFNKGRFSFNIKGGRCEKCQGAGLVKIEMQFLSDLYIICDVCQGMRYNRETLEVKFKGLSIFDILKMTVDDATNFFKNHFKIYQKLAFLKSVGLGYIELGQVAPTFSGGEAQRIKLANELSKKDTGRTLYILDEPTTGLHFYDIEKLLHTLYQLVDRGNTVIVIEHNLDVVKNCQYIIDLGPHGGDKGGKVVYQGEIGGITKVKESYTGEYLNKIKY